MFYQPLDEKITRWTLRFPAKENPNMGKVLFDWPIVLEHNVKAKYRLISRKFLGHEVFSAEHSLYQLKATRVCVRSINQSNRSISVPLLFLFCSRFHFKVIQKSLYLIWLIYINAQVANGGEKRRRVCYAIAIATSSTTQITAEVKRMRWTRILLNKGPTEGFNNHLNATNATYATHGTHARKRETLAIKLKMLENATDKTTIGPLP